MPHLTLEYSRNLDGRIDIPAMVDCMHEVAAGIDVLPVGGLRTRAVARDHYRIADGHPDNAFVNAVLRIAPGRSAEAKKAAGETLFGALAHFLNAAYDRSPLAISLEIQELDAELRWKKNNLRAYMAEREEEQ